MRATHRRQRLAPPLDARYHLAMLANAPPSPLRIDTVAVPGGGVLGMLHCPGRCGGSYGQRVLAEDFKAVEAWGARILLSLNEPHEFARLGVPTFMSAAQTRTFDWLHAPIPDFAAPGDGFQTAWREVGPRIAAALDDGARVAVHCAAGLGRTGTLVAKLLVDRGMSAREAMAAVRAARPGTIETTEQAAFVRAASALL